MPMLMQNRYRIMRRVVQLSVLALFVAGSNVAGWKVLQGDLSTSLVLGTVPLADPFALLQVFAAGTMVAGQALLGGGIVLLFFAAIGGRAFCGWVCPVNMVTDLADTVSTAAGAGRSLRLNRNIRYWVFGLSLVLSALLGIAAFEWISPIGALHRGVIYGMGLGWTSVAAVFLFDLVAVKNGFCGHICPLGAFYSLAGGKSVIRVHHDVRRCSQCMRCVESCPEPQVLPMVGKSDGTVTSGECTNCGRCIEVCPDRAMRFGTRAGVTDRGPKEGAS